MVTNILVTPERSQAIPDVPVECVYSHLSDVKHNHVRNPSETPITHQFVCRVHVLILCNKRTCCIRCVPVTSCPQVALQFLLQGYLQNGKTTGTTFIPGKQFTCKAVLYGLITMPFTPCSVRATTPSVRMYAMRYAMHTQLCVTHLFQKELRGKRRSSCVVLFQEVTGFT